MKVQVILKGIDEITDGVRAVNEARELLKKSKFVFCLHGDDPIQKVITIDGESTALCHTFKGVAIRLFGIDQLDQIGDQLNEKAKEMQVLLDAAYRKLSEMTCEIDAPVANAERSRA